MADVKSYHHIIESHRRVIESYQYILRLYEQHHQVCLAIPRDAYASLEQALEALSIPNTLPENSPHNQANDLQVIPFCGISSSNQQRPYRKAKKRPSNSKVAVDMFIRDAPKDWRSALSDANISISYISERMVNGIAPVPSQTTGYVHTTTLQTARYYAQKTASWIKAAQNADAFSRFQLFCFLSYCVALQHSRIIDTKDLDGIMKVVVVGEDVTEKYFQEVRKGTRRAHNIFLKLVDAGWPISQATLLFYFCAPRRTFSYKDLTSRGVDDIVNRLKPKKCESMHSDDVRFCIPELIAKWDPSLSVETLYSALGYDTLFQALISPPSQPSTLDASPHSQNQSTPRVGRPLKRKAAHQLGRQTELLEHHPQAECLLSLLFYLAPPGYPIDISLLEYGGKSRKRWTSLGELESFSASDLGLDHTTVDLLCNSKELSHTLELLGSMGYVKYDDGKLEVISEDTTMDERGTKWEQAMILVCYYFSGCEYSPEYSKIGRSALQLLQRFLEGYKLLTGESRLSLRSVVVHALLEASKFSTLSWKRNIVAILEQEVSSMEPYIQSHFAVRKAFVLRSEGKWDEACQLVKDCLSVHRAVAVDGRLSAIRGLLTSALASSLWEREKFDEATLAWRTWSPSPETMSLYESRVSIRVLTSTGVANLNNGRYSDAIISLESARAMYDASSRPLQDVIANLSDAYCESGMPETALAVLGPDTNVQGSLGDRYHRKWCISYAEALVSASQYSQAEAMLQSLKKHFEESPDLERVDRRIYIRVLSLLAQNLHRQASSPIEWNETRQRWTNAVVAAEQFDEVSRWDFGMICFSLHHATLESGGNSEWLDRGRTEFRLAGRFWMRGMGTYWRSFMISKLPIIREVVGASNLG